MEINQKTDVVVQNSPADVGSAGKTADVELKVKTAPECNVTVDRENVQQFTVCCAIVCRFLAAFLLLLLIFSVYISSIVFLFIATIPSVDAAMPGNRDYAFWLGMSWIAYTFCCIGYAFISGIIGQESILGNKINLFRRWRMFCARVLPFLLYALLWIPSLLQQFNATHVAANSVEFATRRWIVFGVCWCLVHGDCDVFL